MVERRRLATATSKVVVMLAVLVALAAPGAAWATTAVVALGDSEISGEGAGSYASGSNGPTNYCHRSLKSWPMVVAVPVDVHVNLACSGAKSTNLTLAGSGQYGERSQAAQLIDVARQHRVKAVFVTIGANDDPRFGPTATDCVTNYVLLTGTRCSSVHGPTWQSRVDAMVPKATAALADVRAAMAQAGYAAGAYTLVVVSYASPVPHRLRYYDWQYFSKLYAGCPLYNADATWGHDVATPVLNGGVRAAATAASAKYLTLSGAIGGSASGFDGHELCSSGTSWVRGLTYAPGSSAWYSSHAVQQSLHPNATGHAQIASCVAGFLTATYREGACRLGSDGLLHPAALS